MLHWTRFRRHSPTREDLRDALAVTASFQNYVQHADGKVNFLIVVHAGTAAVVATQASAAAKLTQVGSFLGCALLGVFVAGFLVSGYHMLQVIRPVLRPPVIHSRYGITGIKEHRSVAVEEDIAIKIAEAWAMTRLFAEIAERKHRHLLRALPWTGAMLVSAILWTVLVATWQ